MNRTIDVDQYVATIRAQRDQALDAVAQLQGIIATQDKELEALKPKGAPILKGKNAGKSSAPA